LATARAFFGELDPVRRRKNAARQRREVIPRKWKQLYRGEHEPPMDPFKNLFLRHCRPAIRDAISALLYTSGVTRPKQSGAHRLNIVTFHRVLPEEQLREYPLPNLAVSVDEFRWFIAYFKAGFTTGTLTELQGRWSTGERPDKPFLAITFDDGQLDNFLYARPILEQAGMRGTFYIPVRAIQENQTLWHDRLAYAFRRMLVIRRHDALQSLSDMSVPDTVNDKGKVAGLVESAKSLSPSEREILINRIEDAVGGSCRPAWDGMMSWSQLRELASSGHEVGSHSMSHQLLDQLEDDTLEYEVFASRRTLEGELDSPITTFCYPNGNAGKRVVAAVREAGYVSAVSTRWGSNTPGARLWELKRYDIQSATSRSRRGTLSKPRLAMRMSPLSMRF
jgi:peptidoglycan/xylan/chitin deacetylase (PgdA/CDA1 family)